MSNDIKEDLNKTSAEDTAGQPDPVDETIEQPNDEDLPEGTISGEPSADADTEPDAEPESDGDEDQDTETDYSDIDYEAELIAEREAREQAETDRDNYKQGLLNAKSKLKEAKDAGDNQLDIDTLNQTVNQLVDQRVKSIQTVDGVIAQMTTDPKKAESLKYHYENTVKHTGSDLTAITRDLGRCALIVDEKKIINENEELRAALRSRNNVSNAGAGSSHKKPQSSPNKKFSASDQKIMAKYNLQPDEIKDDGVGVPSPTSET